MCLCRVYPSANPSAAVTGDPMKWLIVLLLALIASIAGIMLSEGGMKYVFQVSFFVVLILSFLTLTLDVSRA